MGNGIGKFGHCFVGEVTSRHEIAVIMGDPLREGLGHSFCYIRPDPPRLSASSSSKVHTEYYHHPTTAAATTTNTVVQTATFFSSISGASVSANTSTQTLSTALIDYSWPYSSNSATFESSDSFASLPLQPVPRRSFQSGSGSSTSGPIERGFLSGPIERGYLSGPIDRGLYSGPITDKLQRSSSQNGINSKSKSKKQGLLKIFKRAISKTISRGMMINNNKSSKGAKDLESERNNNETGSDRLSSRASLNNENGVVVTDDDDGEFCSMKSQNLQWAQGKAGEDRMQIVVSEERGWVFVGIYDGFNGPDAPDYLINNLYPAVHKELKGLLWNDKLESSSSDETQKEIFPLDDDSKRKMKGNSNKGIAKKCVDFAWDREKLELERKLNCEGSNGLNDIHSDVLKALSQALKKTEDSYLEVADKMVMENPELALMGSCVLVMLMKGEDVYLMNVGDSRAVLGRKFEPNIGLGKAGRDLKRINEETMHNHEAFDGDDLDRFNNLTSLQLTTDHSTHEEEVICFTGYLFESFFMLLFDMN